MSKLSYQLASWPDEDVLVAEIFLEDEDIGHVALHGLKFDLTLYRENDQHLTVDVEDLEKLLATIRQRLLS